MRRTHMARQNKRPETQKLGADVEEGFSHLPVMGREVVELLSPG